mmetsp:Transcript_2722/g.5065  ORF Transcript_2722/g.5065 Transcript_2722/m.5065 type:complete len:100 (-) Transcript_2722:1120-1419(-)
MTVLSKGVDGTGGLSKKSDCNATPDSISEVDGNGINSIIDLELDKKSRPEDVRPSGDNSDDEGCPWLDDGAAGGDSNQSREGAVHAHGDIVHGLTSRPA